MLAQKRPGADLKPLKPYLVQSGVIHIALFVIGLIFNHGFNFGKKPPIDLEAEIVWSSDVRIAKTSPQPKPKEKVKQIVVPKQPKPKGETVKVETKKVLQKEVPQAPVDVPVKDDKADKRKKAMQDALAALKKDTDEKNEPAGGVQADGLGRPVQEAIFRTAVKRKIENNLFVTSADWFGKYKNRRVQCVFKIDAEGKLVSVRVRKSSGVPSIDANVLAAIRKSAPFIAPTRELQRKYVNESFVINFSPGNVELN